MELLREKFFKTFSNIPINLRDDIIIVLENEGTVTWKVAYFEIKNKTVIGNKILKELKELDLI